MAKIVLGIATSHTPMLNTPAKDWPSFIDRDGVRDFLDKEGEPATYEELLTRADPRALPELTPERFAEGLGAWLTQRGKGEGEPLVVRVTRE